MGEGIQKIRKFCGRHMYTPHNSCVEKAPNAPALTGPSPARDMVFYISMCMTKLIETHESSKTNKLTTFRSGCHSPFQP